MPVSATPIVGARHAAARRTSSCQRTRSSVSAWTQARSGAASAAPGPTTSPSSEDVARELTRRCASSGLGASARSSRGAGEVGAGGGERARGAGHFAIEDLERDVHGQPWMAGRAPRRAAISPSASRQDGEALADAALVAAHVDGEIDHGRVVARLAGEELLVEGRERIAQRGERCRRASGSARTSGPR